MKTPKTRNLLVLDMITNGQKSGPHKDKKKEQSKKACRQKVKY